MSVHAVPEIVVVPQLAPNLDRHEVVGSRVLEGGVNGDHRAPEGRDILRIVISPPFPPHDITAFRARAALVQSLPCSHAAVCRVVQVARLELGQPRIVFPKLRGQCVTHRTAKEIHLLSLNRQADQGGSGFVC